jgi:FAD/FMN-containing dehydrogenase
MSGDGATRAIQVLAGAVSGRVIRPSEPEYDAARRVWNGMIDRKPLAVVRAAQVADVAPVIRLASQHGLALAVRGGGHNVAGNGTVDDGIVLDLGDLRRVEVDAVKGTVRVEPGVTLGDVDQATEPAGLVVPSGVVSGTGLVGLTLGGGFGWLTRPYGLTIDNLLSAEVVTADGSVHAASESDNPDLFWGLRGGGGNFGVVTSLTFRAQQLGPQVYAGNLFYGRAKWAEALAAYAEWTADLPDELTSIVSLLVPPPAWQLGDDRLLIIGFSWAAPHRPEVDKLIGRLRAAAAPDEEVIQPSRWVEWQSQADGLFPRGVRAYWKNVALDHLASDVIDAIVRHSESLPRGIAIDIHHMDGAFAGVPEEATAFPDRSARYWLNLYSFWADAPDDDDHIARIRALHADLAPHARPGQYVNFLGNEGIQTDARQQALAAYGPTKLARLIELKRRYDPQNLFRLNHNVPVD